MYYYVGQIFNKISIIRLQTGWSVKTGSLDSKWSTYSNSYSSGTNRCAQSFVLSDEEQQTIIQVQNFNICNH